MSSVFGHDNADAMGEVDETDEVAVVMTEKMSKGRIWPQNEKKNKMLIVRLQVDGRCRVNKEEGRRKEESATEGRALL